MEVRIGTTLTGRGAAFDTSAGRTLLLVGDMGRGKTTAARHVTRWWLADTNRHTHVFASTPSEWADLRHPRSVTSFSWSTERCQVKGCLVVVDDIDTLDDTQLSTLPWGKVPLVLTSIGGRDLDQEPPAAAMLDVMGLIRPDHPDPIEVEVLNGQGRLDWPAHTQPIIPATRGSVDFPCHRWQAPADSWLAVAQ